MIKDLLQIYKDNLLYVDFYEEILCKCDQNSKEYTTNSRFLNGYIKVFESNNNEKILNLPESEDSLRIDIPVWFGSPEASKNRVIVYGSEPRDTNGMFNIEINKNITYGATFGCNRWNDNTNVSGKTQLKYKRVFESLINHESTFILFSDIVKFYQVISTSESRKEMKQLSDKEARRRFNEFAEQSKEMVLKEIEIISPDLILLLGRPAQKVFERIIKPFIPKTNIRIENIRHPSYGGTNIALQQIEKIYVE